ncbi:MAG TPA: molybdopterin-dependent oxidoreductase [Candidatus Limnocylindria bacterium]|nr:molybdopterin-dependent oxidoreductase [Candidatus Limnocylindria bacterium]
MTTAALDRLLAALVAAQIVTGLLSLRAGSPPTAPLFVAHGILGGLLAVAVAVKLRRSVPGAVAGGRWRELALASVLAVLTIGALAGGFAWVASGRILTAGPWTILTLHVWAALALLPLALLHLAPRRWRLLVPARRRRAGSNPRREGRLVSRRALMAGTALGFGGVLAWLAAETADRLQGGVRRFTGSRWLPDGGVPPPTTFFGESTQPIDAGAWRLTVGGRVRRPLSLDLAGLGALGHVERNEVLDCTSGWVMRTSWRGTPVGAVLDAAEPLPGARHAVVRSVTGWYARLPLDEARGALLATHVAGQSLAHGNGAPCRLVAPDRRGLEWVKWVTELEIA